MSINPTPRQLGALKTAVFLFALLPCARMLWLTLSGQLVEPLEFLTRGSGDWTLYFLCITLAVTPLRRLTQWNWLIKLRRMLGLFV
ncbi:MAG TPA: sulfoxide reductase heme-binding subunit YedZ, partial [Janthinobacterium sp.]|nr:sulfoxide reductase heme-binding subunit YedZ [Janthinobacterium sp.]